MSNSKIRNLLEKAKTHEKKYDWVGAADFYDQASNIALDNFRKIAELRERVGYCFLRAAFQAETNKEFRSKMNQSIEAFEKSVSYYQRINAKEKVAKINHAKAMSIYGKLQFAKSITKRREMIDDCLKLEFEALNYYKQVCDKFGIGYTSNNLAELFREKRIFESEWKSVKNAILEGIRFGEAAIAALSEANDDFELARAYTLTNKNYANAIWFRVLKRSEEIRQKSLYYSRKALELSKNTGDAYIIGLANLNQATRTDVTKSTSISLNFWKEGIKYGRIANDKYIMGRGSAWAGLITYSAILMEVDPDKQREGFRKALKLVQEGIYYLSIIGDYSTRFSAYFGYVDVILFLSSIETKPVTKRRLLQKAVEIGREHLKGIGEERIMYCTILFHAFSQALYGLSEIETNQEKKLRLLRESLDYRKRQLASMEKISPFDFAIFSRSHNEHARILEELAKNETGEKKIKLLEKAVKAMEKCIELVQKDLVDSSLGIKRYGLYYNNYGRILEYLYSLTKDKRILDKAIEIYKGAIQIFSKAKNNVRIAESYWKIARLKNHLGDNLESAHNYMLASENYQSATENIPRLKAFYHHYSVYMQAWSEIEKAKHNHSIEEYTKSKTHYQKAANLHKSTEQWSYLTKNYLAWAQMEKAEDLSRKDEIPEAIETFRQAMDCFKKSEKSLQTKLKGILEIHEKEMINKLIRSSNMRQKYCQARISIEKAKILDRKGKFSLSARSYGAAVEKLSKIIEETDHEQILNELRMVMTLSQAWQKMAMAEEKTSPELYLEASQLFEQASKFSLTKRNSLLSIGNSSFCKGLAAGIEFQNTLDDKIHSKAKGHVKSAATCYLKAGFKEASEHAKATQRLFDAYLYMNKAEMEIDAEKSAKYYYMAEKVLKISADSFRKAKQPERTAEVRRILDTVKEEKELAVSLTELLRAPSITSTTVPFTTPTPTSEESVGLEKFEHANVQANLKSGTKEAKVGESFFLSVEFINAGKQPALLLRVEDFIPRDFFIVKKPEVYQVEDHCINMKGKQLAPLKLVEVMLVVQPSKKGDYKLKPKVQYMDERGHNKCLQLKTLHIKVAEVVLADRVSTGTQELDSLLLGGFPEDFAVILTGSPSDEREYLIKNFLVEGSNNDETVFYVTTEADGLEPLLKNPNVHLFLCNPKPKTKVPDLPNVTKLSSKTDLTNLSISLFKAYRKIKPSKNKRICIEIVSDILITFQAEATRRWISDLITDLLSKGFTVLCVMNPAMHPSDQATAVIDLFDGEISIIQSDDPLDCKKSILVKKLRNQDYIKNPICLA